MGPRPGLASSPAGTTLVHGLSTRYLDGFSLQNDLSSALLSLHTFLNVCYNSRKI